MDPLLAHTRPYRVAPSTSRAGPVRFEPVSRRQRRVVCSVLDAARSCFGTMKRSSPTRCSWLRPLWTRRYRRMNNVIFTPLQKLRGTRSRTCGRKASGIEYQQCGVLAARDGIESTTRGFFSLCIPPRVGLRCLRLARASCVLVVRDGKRLLGVGNAQAAPIGSGWSGRQPQQVFSRPDNNDLRFSSIACARLRADDFVMHDPAKWRLLMIVAAIALFVVGTFVLERLMH
jgi:hypothetical protein